MKNRLICCFVFCCTAAHFATADGLIAEDVYIRAAPPGQQTTVGYLSLINYSDRACTITGGSSSIASKLEIHEHQHSDGMMKMRPVPSLTVPAGETQVFRPGGFHLMLFGVDRQLTPGESHSISLTSEDCGSVAMVAEVRSLFKKSDPAPKMKSHSMNDHSMNDHSMGKHGMHKQPVSGDQQ